MAEPLANLYRLQTFHRVATERSFTRAARQLHLSQPAVSAHIRALERHFGARLFVVRHRRVHLTAEGEALFAYSVRVFNLLREAERAVAETQGLERGQLHVGASATIGIYLLPPVLVEFARQYPAVQVELTVGTSADIVARVLADEVPLGLVEASVTHPDLDVEPFAADEMVLIVPPDHPWARAGAISIEALQGTAILRREPGSGTQAFVDATLEHAGARLATAMVLGSTEALKQAVLAGGGVAWVPRITVARELQSGTLAVVAVPAVDLRRDLSVIRPRGARPGSAAAALLRLLRADGGPRAAPTP
ncbi:MAG TPA: LysR family transcriptional regulator [Chloroflexota bacterium]|nr:LysR family transcriptional regulator [Chloroflexota bacterium]